MKDDLESCKSLADQLGEPYTAMKVGKIRRNVCTDDDMEGKFIKPSGVLKIMQAIGRELDIIETATPDQVWIRVLHHKTGNPRRIFAEDLDTRKKVSVIVPATRKKLLNIKGKKLKVERGIKDGEHFYRYPIQSRTSD